MQHDKPYGSVVKDDIISLMQQVLLFPCVAYANAKSEVSAAVRYNIESFWVMTPCNLVCEYKYFGGTHPEVAGNMFLRQVGTKILEYTVI